MKHFLFILFFSAFSLAQNSSENHSHGSEIIRENKIKGLVKIYPNPASTIIVVETTKDVKMNNITIYSLLGNKVYDEKLTKEKKITLNLSKIKNGKYFIKILLENNELLVKSFIKN